MGITDGETSKDTLRAAAFSCSLGAPRFLIPYARAASVDLERTAALIRLDSAVPRFVSTSRLSPVFPLAVAFSSRSCILLLHALSSSCSFLSLTLKTQTDLPIHLSFPVFLPSACGERLVSMAVLCMRAVLGSRHPSPPLSGSSRPRPGRLPTQERCSWPCRQRWPSWCWVQTDAHLGLCPTRPPKLPPLAVSW